MTTPISLEEMASDPVFRAFLEEFLVYIKTQIQAEDWEFAKQKNEFEHLCEILKTLNSPKAKDLATEAVSIPSLVTYGKNTILAEVEGGFLEVRNANSEVKQLYVPIENFPIARQVIEQLAQKMQVEPSEVAARAISLLHIASHATSQGKKIGIVGEDQDLEIEIRGI
ncbi:MAG: hypothetical protein KME16_09145 [Scytolyngbya sp. HA4215-MV1]|jgi:hypothetical protein|nr:hypothetical protein [Scytolyngbya sp. HA4215-MV1]